MPEGQSQIPREESKSLLEQLEDSSKKGREEIKRDELWQEWQKGVMLQAWTDLAKQEAEKNPEYPFVKTMSLYLKEMEKAYKDNIYGSIEKIESRYAPMLITSSVAEIGLEGLVNKIGKEKVVEMAKKANDYILSDKSMSESTVTEFRKKLEAIIETLNR
ncbi:MAG: hypothetical protein ACD_76C00054G0009 [uncultured bacterium]|nr:MAG: hypothetical protein ACD_76C00054G0009 [uncultured bacterium]HBD05645.1 hypothetical protein [Candidatus Uhrbacteria bacterium]